MHPFPRDIRTHTPFFACYLIQLIDKNDSCLLNTGNCFLFHFCHINESLRFFLSYDFSGFSYRNPPAPGLPRESPSEEILHVYAHLLYPGTAKDLQHRRGLILYRHFNDCVLQFSGNKSGSHLLTLVFGFFQSPLKGVVISLNTKSPHKHSKRVLAGFPGGQWNQNIQKPVINNSFGSMVDFCHFLRLHHSNGVFH